MPRPGPTGCRPVRGRNDGRRRDRGPTVVRDPDGRASDGDVGGTGERLRNHDGAYGHGGAAAGWVAFEVPKPRDAGGATITWPGGECALDDRAVERPSHPPTDFELWGSDAPDAMELDETVTATLTVENVGDADGRFVAAVNRAAHRVHARGDALAGRSRRRGGDVGVREPSRRQVRRPLRRGRTMTVRLHWRGRSLSRETEVETSAKSPA